jgi:hypothetical protein
MGRARVLGARARDSEDQDTVCGCGMDHGAKHEARCRVWPWSAAGCVVMAMMAMMLSGYTAPARTKQCSLRVAQQNN